MRVAGVVVLVALLGGLVGCGSDEVEAPTTPTTTTERPTPTMAPSYEVPEGTYSREYRQELHGHLLGFVGWDEATVELLGPEPFVGAFGMSRYSPDGLVQCMIRKIEKQYPEGEVANLSARRDAAQTCWTNKRSGMFFWEG